ncbi:MAG: substrate-binding domain-containing protein [Roseovarius sp.]
MTDKKPEKADIIAVAKAAKVSASTVSRSFNHPELVNPATRRRIQRAVERTGYIRNRAAQSIHGRRSATVGLVVPTINHAIFAEVIQAFSDAIDRAGFTLLIASHSYNLDREYDMIRKLLEHRVDGVALIGLEHSEATFNLLEQQAIPALAIWNYAEASPMPCVGASNIEAGRLAAQHLTAIGHRQIGLIFPGTDGNDRALDRRAGALQVLGAAGADLREDWNVTAPYSIAQAKAAAARVLSQDIRPSALLCGNDVLAQGALYAAHGCGLRVPEDVSIIGIGDFKGSGDIEPGLTTIAIPATEIGTLAGERFVEYITADTREMFRVSCALQTVVRGTTQARAAGRAQT